MKNLWLKIKDLLKLAFGGTFDQELALSERYWFRLWLAYRRQELAKAQQADALLYGVGISRVEPKDFYGTGVAELTLAELRDQAVNSPYHAMRSAELWQDYIARQLPKDKKRARKHKKIGRKKRNIRPK